MALAGGQNLYKFLVTSGCLLSRKVLWAVRIGSFWPILEVFYRPEWTKRGTTWKWILSIFKFRNEWYKRLEQKSRWKKGIICLMFAVWVMVLKQSEKIFWNSVLTSAKNLLKQFRYMHSKAFSENDILYCAMTYCFGNIRVWSQRTLLNFCRVSIFFDILIVNISRTVA